MLRERSKKLIELRLQGYSCREICEILNINKNTFNASMGRLRKCGYIPAITVEEQKQRLQARQLRRGNAELIASMSRNGVKFEDIASQLGVAYTYVSRTMTKFYEKEKEKAVLLYNHGLSYDSISKVMNWSMGRATTFFYRLIKKDEIPVRNKCYYPKRPAKNFEVFPIGEELCTPVNQEKLLT